MKYTYEVITPEFGDKLIKRNDGAFIPMDESNSDYQAYLASLDEQQATAKDVAN